MHLQCFSVICKLNILLNNKFAFPVGIALPYAIHSDVALIRFVHFFCLAKPQFKYEHIQNN